METANRSYTAFHDDRQVATGDLAALLTDLSERLPLDERRALLVFEDWTGRQVDFDWRGSAADVLARAEAARAGDAGPSDASPTAGRRGRPKLGVVSREVTLLPRHWEWLEGQPNGISASLRRLVDEARKREPEKDRARRAVEAASRVMTALAGDRPGYEEASRALFAGDRARFAVLTSAWPADVRGYLERLIAAAD